MCASCELNSHCLNFQRARQESYSAWLMFAEAYADCFYSGEAPTGSREKRSKTLDVIRTVASWLINLCTTLQLLLRPLLGVWEAEPILLVGILPDLRCRCWYTYASARCDSRHKILRVAWWLSSARVEPSGEAIFVDYLAYPR